MLVNSFCVTENGAIECQNMPGQVLYMDDLIEGVQSRGTDLLNNLKPFGWVSKELSLKRVSPNVCVNPVFGCSGIVCNSNPAVWIKSRNCRFYKPRISRLE